MKMKYFFTLRSSGRVAEILNEINFVLQFSLFPMPKPPVIEETRMKKENRKEKNNIVQIECL